MLKGNFITAITAPFSSASGNLIAAAVSLPTNLPQTITFQGCSNLVQLYGTVDEIDSVKYLIQTGAGVSAGAVSVQTLNVFGTWITETTPNSATGAAFTLIATLGATTTYGGSFNVSGSIFMPCLGIRLTVSGLTGGSITAAQLNCTVR